MLTAALATRVVSIALLAALGFGAWKRSRKSAAPPIPQIITTLEGTITLGEAAQDIEVIARSRTYPTVGIAILYEHRWSRTTVCQDANGRTYQVPSAVANDADALRAWIQQRQ